MRSVAVCIATVDRHHLLERTLGAVAALDPAPAEVIVADGSRGAEREAMRARCAAIAPAARWLEAATAALPRLRRTAREAATSELLLFLDDDVLLVPDALGHLASAWTRLESAGGASPVGIGLQMHWIDGGSPVRDTSSWRERWLGTSTLASGSLTDGGLSVSHAGLAAPDPIPVSHLWGGAMAYRRDVLEALGPLASLEALYDSGFGRGEDVILSRAAARAGPLYLLTGALALHRRDTDDDEPTPYAASGWRLGMTATWGRAHSLRWVAADPVRARRDWWRVATLEVARAGWEVARRPWRPAGWSRAAGALTGTARGWWQWSALPEHAWDLSGAAAR